MKVLHINSYYATTALYTQLYDRQVQSGINIDVFVPIAKQFPETELKAKGNYTQIVRAFNQYDRFWFPLKHHKILSYALKQYHIHRYDLIHAHSLFSNGWVARHLSRKGNRPYVVAVRSADVKTFFEKMPWMRRTGVAILRSATKIIFISKSHYQEVFEKYIPAKFEEELKAKSLVIPNGIDQSWLDTGQELPSKKAHKPIRVVSTGQLIRRKRMVPLAEMSAQYSENISPLELHIIGEAKDASIERALKRYPHVAYHGKLNPEQMRRLYLEMDIFALLSGRETFGLVYAEAMSQGLPVIYTQGQGFDNFFDNRTIGVSVEKSDQIGFNQAIDYIIDNYHAMSELAKKEAQQFNWDKINDQYINLYQAIIGKGR